MQGESRVTKIQQKEHQGSLAEAAAVVEAIHNFSKSCRGRGRGLPARHRVRHQHLSQAVNIYKAARGKYLHRARIDNVEVLSWVALAEHDVTGLVCFDLRLLFEQSELLVTEIGEGRYRGKKVLRSHACG